jgi:hypothetical protein
VRAEGARKFSCFSVLFTRKNLPSGDNQEHLRKFERCVPFMFFSVFTCKFLFSGGYLSKLQKIEGEIYIFFPRFSQKLDKKMWVGKIMFLSAF